MYILPNQHSCTEMRSSQAAYLVDFKLTKFITKILQEVGKNKVGCSIRSLQCIYFAKPAAYSCTEMRSSQAVETRRV